MRRTGKVLCVIAATSVVAPHGGLPAARANLAPAAAAAECTDPNPRWFDVYSQESSPSLAGGANAWGYIWVDPAEVAGWYRVCVDLTVKDTAGDSMAAVAWATFTTRDGSTVRMVLDRVDGYGNSIQHTYKLPPMKDFFVSACRAAGSNWTAHCSPNG